MKKTVKSLIIAASVAAVAGIGAVSFAAWSGGQSEKTQNITSGTINAVGFSSMSVYYKGSSTEEAIPNDTTTIALMPFDQGTNSTTLGNNQAIYYKVVLTTANGEMSNMKISAKVAPQTDGGVPDNLKIKFSTTALSSITKTENEQEVLDGFSDLDSGSTTVDLTGIAAGTTYYAYIALDSNDASYTANAGRAFTVTFTLADAS